MNANRVQRPGVYRVIVRCSHGTAHQNKCSNDCLCCMWKVVTYSRCNVDRLKSHIRLCRRNLRSDRVKCCATCPFEEEIVAAYPDMEKEFMHKRREREYD